MEREINGKMVETDPEGYLVNLEDWSEELAVELAKEDNLELGENHWKVINHMREQFSQNGTAPNLRFLQKGLKEEFGAEWGDKKFLFELFPFGPAKQAGRYAGTPKPTGCV
ncbi:MAG: TusE/DsrC/DsvC family sulfur relay protein [Thiobacillus sp.]